EPGAPPQPPALFAGGNACSSCQCSCTDYRIELVPVQYIKPGPVQECRIYNATFRCPDGSHSSCQALAGAPPLSPSLLAGLHRAQPARAAVPARPPSIAGAGRPPPLRGPGARRRLPPPEPPPLPRQGHVAAAAGAQRADPLP